MVSSGITSNNKMDPEGHIHEPSGKARYDNDQNSSNISSSSSNNKHLTRLVRFSILQARRSSQASKAAQQQQQQQQQQQNNKQSSNNVNTKVLPGPPAALASATSPKNVSPRKAITPRASNGKFPAGHYASFSADKERPSTEVQYEYNDAPGKVGIVDVPRDPPIIEDLSASLTLSDGENANYSGSLSDDGDHHHHHPPHHPHHQHDSRFHHPHQHPHDQFDDHIGDHEDPHMDLLLAPDSESAEGEVMMLHPSSSNEVYNSAEMYSSSGNYESGSDISSDSSDSIMRRVEEEIANARKASNDAQARLAYFTQKQRELSPVLTDSYSFDFDNLESQGDPTHNNSMLDVGEVNQFQPDFQGIGPRGHHPSHRHHHSHGGGSHHTATTQDENFNNAMGVIGKEFDTSSTDVEEKVDIEVVLAPSSQQRNLASPTPAASRSPPAYNRRSPRVPPMANARSPRHRNDDSVDIDDAVISAVFSEKSIESLPVKESIQAVFSEQSMDSLPTQPTPTQSSVAQSSLGKPASYSFQEQDHALSPSGSPHKRQQNLLPNSNRGALSPHQRTPMQANMSIVTDNNFAAKDTVSPLATTMSSSPYKLPSTPREANTPSYRERLENKLKILGSRYPVSPVSKSAGTTPSNKKETFSRLSEQTQDRSASPTKTSKMEPDMPVPQTPITPKDTISGPASVASPLGEAYDGLESRIKDLLARTLNPGPPEMPPQGEREMAYQSSPSAELKAIKKLLEQGVAAAAAAEERKREMQERQALESQQATPVAGSEPQTSLPSPWRQSDLGSQEAQLEDLRFPLLDEHEENVAPEVLTQQSQGLKSKSSETAGSATSEVKKLHMRSPGSVPPVLETPLPDEAKNAEPSITCSTSEEILEALDSFSQSAEFKSQSLRHSKANPLSSSPQPEDDEGDNLNSDVNQVFDQSENNNETDGTRAPACEQKPPVNSNARSVVASLKTYLESAIKPSSLLPPGGEHSKSEEEEEEEEEEYPQTESSVDRNESDTENFQTVADSASLQESVQPEQHETPPIVEKTRSASNEVNSREEMCDSEYESCADEAKDEERARGVVATARRSESQSDSGGTRIGLQEGQSQSTVSSEVNAQAANKKTPSVLNAALSRPAAADSREHWSNLRRARQKVSVPQEISDEEDKAESDTDVAVVPSNSQATDEGSVEEVASANTEDVLKEPSGNADLSSQNAQSDKKCIRNEPTPVSPKGHGAPDIEAQPTNESEGSGAPQTSPREQSMLASLINPSINPEPHSEPTTTTTTTTTKTKTTAAGAAGAAGAADANEHEEAVHQSGSKGKSVTVLSPPSPSHEADEKILQDKNDDANQKTTNRSDRKIRFRDPYPTPKPCRKPRSTEEIQRDHNCKPSHSDRKTRWKEPKGDLKRLLVAALDSSLSRRSNACGALKVISKLEKNKVILVRTKGFLEALVFVATDEITSDEPEAKEDARARAISCLYNVSHVKENRLIVCTHTGLLECLVKTINEDRGEARMEACGIMAQLAKSPNCRDLMVSVEELLSTLASVLKGTIDPEEKMLNVLSEDATEDAPSSYSEMSSVLSEEHIPFPKTSRNSRTDQRAQGKVRTNYSIRKQKSEMYDQYFELARLSACAALIHLSKQCSILDHFCSNMFLLESIVQVARDSKSQLHCKCLEMLCNISRLPGNTATMTRFPGMVDTLVGAGSSKEQMDRTWALRTLQNMTSDASSKAPLATSTLLTLLINCVTSRNTDEQHAAMATLLNLSTDPSAVVPITSTKNVLATLVYLAHNADSTSEIRLMACNALATVGLWLQTVSGFGSIPEDTRRVLLPSHKTTGWDIWE